MSRHCLLFLAALTLVFCPSPALSDQAEESINHYWSRLLDPSSGGIAREVKLTQNVYCTATRWTPEFYITRKVVELAPKKPSSQEVNKILTEMFENEVPKDREVIAVVFRWFPNGPEYTLPADMAAGAVLSNDQGVRVRGELEEELVKDLTLRANGGEYRSMILGFKRKVPQGKARADVDILENAKSITLELPHLTKGGKPVSFTWNVLAKYPTRPFEMALLIDFAPDKFKIVW